MHTVEEELFVWHEIHKALEDARQRLRTVVPSAGPAGAAAAAEVMHLQQQSDGAFAEVQARLADRQRNAATLAGSPRPATLL